MSRALVMAAAGASGPATYIEDVFSTYLYTGSSSSQSIANGIDLTTYGGMVWLKNRVAGTYNHNYVMDSSRGNNSSGYNRLITNLGNAQNLGSISTFNSNGFTLLGGGQEGNENGTSTTSWTFRKQPKFFDCGTYTGNGGSSKTVSHNLTSTPGCIIIKSMTSGEWWAVWHRSTGTQVAYLNDTSGFAATSPVWMGTVDSTSFTLTSGAGNASSTNYVYYAFAHNAGGFGLTGTDNVISCGSFTTDASGNATVNLGYEPQWLMHKESSTTGNWNMYDNMRGLPATANSAVALRANLSNAETGAIWGVSPTATGFTVSLNASTTYIYIAIRRGPMKVPTDATTVFKPLSESGTGSDRTVNAGFPVDTFFIKDRTANSGPTAGGNVFYDRLRGNSDVLQTQSTAAEAVDATYTALFNSTQNGVVVGSAWSSYAYREYCFQRAPGFFDEVCYTGTGSTPASFNHNLGVTPELMIVKRRNGATGWFVWNNSLTNPSNYYLLLQSNVAQQDNGAALLTANATTFTASDSYLNGSGATWVNYLFASCPGVSKVGSYSGTGAAQTINCGFTGGARFVLIKRTDSAGDWYVWDTARGMVSGTDPYELLNSSNAEVNANYVFTSSTGFTIQAGAPSGINASGGTYIYLAIA